MAASCAPKARFGIELQPDPARRAELNDWLTLRPAFAGRILPVSEDILLKWRLLMEDGRKSGHMYSHPDLVLAATALHHGLTVSHVTGAISMSTSAGPKPLGAIKPAAQREQESARRETQTPCARELVLTYVGTAMPILAYQGLAD